MSQDSQMAVRVTGCDAGGIAEYGPHWRARSPRAALILVLLAGAVALSSCSDEGATLPMRPIDTDTPPSYAADIQPIWNVHCGPFCHGIGGFGGLDLQPGVSHGLLVDFVSPTYGAARIAAFDPDASVLLHKISDSGAFGGPMPAAGPRLSNDQIETIRAWISAGALND